MRLLEDQHGTRCDKKAMCLSCSLCRGHFSPRCRAAVPAGKNWIWLALICLDLADGWVLWNEQGWRKVFSPGAMAPLLSQCHCLLPPALKWWKHSVIHCHQVTPNATAPLPAMVPGDHRWMGWGITSHIPPLPWGTHCGMLTRGTGCPLCPVPQLSSLHPQEVSQRWNSSCCPLRHSPGTSSSLCKNKHDGKDFHPLSTSSTTLNFSITWSVK